MFVIQTGRARRTKKYAILMGILCLLTGSLGALFTLHIDVQPKQ